MELYQAIIVQYWNTDGRPASPYVEKAFKPRSSKVEAENDLFKYLATFIEEEIAGGPGKIVEFKNYAMEPGFSVLVAYEDAISGAGSTWTTGVVEVIED